MSDRVDDRTVPLDGAGDRTRAAALPADIAPAAIAPAGWPRGAGYAHGMAARGRVVVAAGQIGWDPATERFASDDLAEQVEQALRNVVAVLRAADAGPEHLVRLTWYITDRAAYLAARPRLGAIWRSVIGRHYPTMSVVVVAGLLEERARVELEATAVVPDRASMT